MIARASSVKRPEANSVVSSSMTFGRVGIVTNGFKSSYYSHVVEAASNYLIARGVQAVVQSKMPRIHDELDALTALSEIACDGLIIHADTLTDHQLEEFMLSNPKSVLLNRRISSCPDRCVHTDNVLGGALAARYLATQGHTCIAMVRGPDKYFEANDRAKGFKGELARHNITLSAELYGNFEQEAGAQTMASIHREHPEVTAVFFHNDTMAFGALHTCRRLKISVPDEISIIGFDDIPMTEYVSPKLTSVKQPLRQIAEHAALMVCDLIFNEDAKKRTVGTRFSPEIYERESVSPLTHRKAPKTALTEREAECLTWTAKGKTSWEISVILGVSESTATFHLRNAGVKLKASNRAHAVAKALNFGLITFTPD